MKRPAVLNWNGVPTSDGHLPLGAAGGRKLEAVCCLAGRLDAFAREHSALGAGDVRQQLLV